MTLSVEPRDVYWRRCRFVRAVDGDTVDVDTDLSRNITVRERLRLLGVNAAEIHAPTPDLRAQAAAAAAFTAHWFMEHWHSDTMNWPFNLRTEKDDAFGRYLAIVECSMGHSLTEDLLSSGNATIWKR